MRTPLAHTLHWLLLTLSLLSVALWTRVPTLAVPGSAPIRADGEAHAIPGEAPNRCPGRPLAGEPGEVEVTEDEREPESESDRGLLAHLARVEISTDRLGACRMDLLWRVGRSKATPMTGGACIRGPPSQRTKFMSI